VLDARHLTRRSFLGGGLASVGATLLPARASRAAVADLDFASALEVARAIRRGDVSSVELTTRSPATPRSREPARPTRRALGVTGGGRSTACRAP